VRHLRGDFFVAMNPDIRFFGDDVVPRLAHHFMHRQVGLVAPALELPDGRTQDSARRTPTPMNLLFRRWIGQERGWIRRGGDVEWIVGAFWMIRRAAWEAVGGCDERYFLYFEDVDLCHRLRGAGWTVRYDPTVRIEHAFQAASRRDLRSWAARQHLRSAARFFADHPRYLLDPRPADVGPPERRRAARLPERRRVPRG
jgi:GT2 family glycosyltransferase